MPTAIMSSTNKLTVLIVEDNSSTLLSLCEYLSRAGYSVRTAANGWEALKVVQAEPVNVIVSAESVTDTDGSSLREKCMLHPDTRDVPFIFLVEDEKTDQLVRALRAGVDDCVEKPFDPVVLVARVQAVLDRREHYERLVRVDPLTRLLNRPTLEEELKLELSRIRRYDRHGSVVLIDIDKFSEVNHDAGVALGDLLLTCLAGVVLSHIRNIDTAGRLLGDRFLVLLPETPPEGAEILARRMQEKMAAIAMNVAGYSMSFTCVIQEVRPANSELEKLVVQLQSALEQAKAGEAGAVHVERILA